MISLILFNVVFLFAIYSMYKYMFSRPQNFPPGNFIRTQYAFNEKNQPVVEISRTSEASIFRQLLVPVDFKSKRFPESGLEIVQNL